MARTLCLGPGVPLPAVGACSRADTASVQSAVPAAQEERLPGPTTCPARLHPNKPYVSWPSSGRGLEMGLGLWFCSQLSPQGDGRSCFVGGSEPEWLCR